MDSNRVQKYGLFLLVLALLCFIAGLISLMGGAESEEIEAPPRPPVKGVVTAIQSVSQSSMSVELMNVKGATVTVTSPSSETAAKMDCVQLPPVQELGGATVEFRLPLSADAASSEPSAEVYTTCWDPAESGKYYFTITADRTGEAR